MKELVWLDLCSGLGGASQPALDRGWKVIRVDIDPRFRPDIVADVRDLSLKFSFRPDVLWASPPCQDFAKWGMRNWYPNPPDPDLSCCQGVSQTIAMMRPQYWVVENVRAARPWLNPIFGRPRAVNVSHVIYGTFPGLLPPLMAHKGGRLRDRRRNTEAMRIALGIDPSRKITDSEMASIRAKIPYEIGEAICRAVEARQ